MNKKRFMLLMLIPIIVILSFIGLKLYIVSFSDEILLKVTPIDPRDMFRGDYVNLNYEISRLNLSNIMYDYSFSNKETIYAVLSQKENFWKVDSVSHTKPKLNKNQVCMKGRVMSSYNKIIAVEWGIESYFLSEGKGQRIDRQRNTKNLSVIVSVDSTCSSVLKKLLINGEPVK